MLELVDIRDSACEPTPFELTGDINGQFPVVNRFFKKTKMNCIWCFWSKQAIPLPLEDIPLRSVWSGYRNIRRSFPAQAASRPPESVPASSRS